MAGRRPKTEAEKQAAGYPGHGKRRKPIKPDGYATRPAFLDETARREWDRIAGDMKLLGLLSRIDQAVFAAYCMMYSTWQKAATVIAKQGATYEANGLVKLRPEWKVMKDAASELRKFATEYGLTPASRTRVTPASPQLPLPGVPDAPTIPNAAEVGDDTARFFGGQVH